MNYDRLRGIRAERKKTQKECADALSLGTPEGYRFKENGISGMSVQQAATLASFLSMTDKEVNEVFFDGKLTKSQY